MGWQAPTNILCPRPALAPPGKYPFHSSLSCCSSVTTSEKSPQPVCCSSGIVHSLNTGNSVPSSERSLGSFQLYTFLRVCRHAGMLIENPISYQQFYNIACTKPPPGLLTPDFGGGWRLGFGWCSGSPQYGNLQGCLYCLMSPFLGSPHTCHWQAKPECGSTFPS